MDMDMDMDMFVPHRPRIFCQSPAGCGQSKHILHVDGQADRQTNKRLGSFQHGAGL